ncbi:MAG: hypothetical protein A3A96_01430 [Candidatus Zambryskibacteria bacterium RIFCSPLOWO2_01_FULL_39_39]|uniref:Uncharacterized protein n=2 Tax=Patescibacteria group TaxID=1783273 RepID=A0A1G2TZT9_9BACT|nr:MAG: hypothetical protein UT61_C0019G0010 [Candidatus Woesebacteria bacterium GW2011_GWA1_39_8]OHA86674.1 MAG: hypothetical protein A2644_03190 [Candidatus Zambryskibacteria bacterium RIFCSPHIGHO2_01_FULL_39_63]OHA95247.1 MAG: hypothetical protein A3B88_02955 [Candidatus Zambryskibacteria bacterium RIFCSPHIGHO2_02_FULL_39_19]OHA98842.1 MAG: hypothetical protein A3F20_02230 [Candidatus Zambryskibacteria bacterium RIFCSPHIGHO2_12_FULL_39_21]OHB02787.1 MAG: hypothetical protein A3A96_01430 [Can
MTWFIASVIIFLAALWKFPKLREWLLSQSGDKRIKDTKILIAVGIGIFNFIVWAMIPWLWEVLYYKWYTLVCFNLGFWAVLYLRTIKTKDEVTGKDTKEDNQTASKLASIIALVVVGGLITTAVYKIRQGDLSKEEYDQKVATEKVMRETFAVEPILQAIASCQPANEFDSVDKVKAARETYLKDGVEGWLSSSDCWTERLGGMSFNLAYRTAPKDELSEMVKIPTVPRNYGLFIDSPQNYVAEINGDKNLIEKKGEKKDVTAYTLKFSGVGEPAKIRVYMRTR